MRRQVIAVAAFLFYPLWSHLAVVSGYPEWSVAGLVIPVAVAITLLAPPGHRCSWPGLALLGGVILAACLDLFARLPMALYLYPIVVPLIGAWFFGHTLLPGRTPLVTQFVYRVRGDCGPKRIRYTRAVTIGWTILFGVLAIGSLALALFADLHTWSLFTNGVNYVVIGLGFIVEFVVRRFVFPDSEGPREYIASLLRTDFRELG